MKVGSIVRFFPGSNTTELKKKFESDKIYTNVDLEYDLYQGFHNQKTNISRSTILEAGDLVINTMTDRAAVVSPKSVGKVIPQNINKLSFIELDDLIFEFN